MDTGSRDKLLHLLTTFRTGMLVTQSRNHALRSRPMSLLKVDEQTGVIWFMTSTDSAKLEDVHASSEVCVTFQHQGRFLSLSGHAALVRDRAKIDELWTEECKIYFPKGKEDPEITLLCVTPKEGEYWDNEGLNRIKFIAEAVRAYVTGTTPDFDKGQHGSVVLNGNRRGRDAQDS